MTVVVDRAIIYAEKEGFRALELDVHRPATATDPRPVVLYVHGGGWRVSSRQRTPRETRAWTPGFFEQIVEAGFVVVANDYRFSGEALYPAAVDDTTDALRVGPRARRRVRWRSRPHRRVGPVRWRLPRRVRRPQLGAGHSPRGRVLVPVDRSGVARSR